MACSIPVKQAQDASFCELCQDEQIDWICVDCDQCVCEKCKIIHLRTRATMNHKVISISMPLEDVQTRIITNNMVCTVHVTKIMCLFCTTCDCLVCPDCVITDHDGHQFAAIESIMDQKLNKLKSHKNELADQLQFCKSENHKLDSVTSKCNALFDKSLVQIKRKEQKMKDAISKQSNLLQDMIEDKRTKVKSKVFKNKHQVEETIEKLDDQIEKVEKALQSNQCQEILKVKMMIPDLRFYYLSNEVEHFIPGGDKPMSIQEWFGTFEKIPIEQPEIEVEVQKSFTTNLPNISQQVALDNTSAWISCFDKEVVMKVNFQNKKMTATNEISCKAYDMVLTKNDELLLSEGYSSKLTTHTQSGETKSSFFTVAPLISKGITFTREKDILVGAVEPGSPFTQSDKSQSSIIVFGMYGNKKHAYQYDADGRNLFTLLYRITTNVYQDILVIDTISSNTGRVVCLDNEGSLKWIYKGHQEVNKRTKFIPMGMAATSVGNTIISDYSSHAIHVISENGDVLKCNVLSDMGITNPRSLIFDKEGHLWIGCSSSMKESRAKMHIAKFYK